MNETEQLVHDLRKLGREFAENFDPPKDPSRSISGLLLRAADMIEKSDKASK